MFAIFEMSTGLHFYEFNSITNRQIFIYKNHRDLKNEFYVVENLQKPSLYIKEPYTSKNKSRSTKLKFVYFFSSSKNGQNGFVLEEGKKVNLFKYISLNLALK